MTRPDDAFHSELTALADGTLSGRRRRRVEERVAGEPGLGAELERQRLAVAALRSTRLEAPARLRERIESERERSRGPAPSRRLAAGGVLAGAATAGAVALALALPGGAGAPTVIEASQLARLPAAAAAPASERRATLAVAAFGLRLPNWAGEFGWRATGLRRDEIDGREAVTVFYEKERRRIGYTIVSGNRIEPPDGAGSAARTGTRLRYVDVRGRVIVTWERRGLTCILSGEGVPRGVLLDLAAWRAGGV